MQPCKHESSLNQIKYINILINNNSHLNFILDAFYCLDAF